MLDTAINHKTTHTMNTSEWRREIKTSTKQSKSIFKHNHELYDYSPEKKQCCSSIFENVMNIFRELIEYPPYMSLRQLGYLLLAVYYNFVEA